MTTIAENQLLKARLERAGDIIKAIKSRNKKLRKQLDSTACWLRDIQYMNDPGAQMEMKDINKVLEETK